MAENDGESFAAASLKRLMKQIKEAKAESLVMNAAGRRRNDDLVTPLIHALIRDDRVNRPGTCL